MPDTYVSRAGYEKLHEELQRLKKRKQELSKEIGEAAEKGDLKENAEYHAAKEKQAETLRRIHELDAKLRKARIIDDLKVEDGSVRIGVKVTLKDDDGDEVEWSLVGQDESDPAVGRISVFSPLAQGLLGHKAGDEVTVALPAGPRKFKILKTGPAEL